MGYFAAAREDERYVLTGRVVTMTDPNRILPNGAVCVQADRIVAVVDDHEHLPEDFARAPIVETNGTIFPGLIELHNHLSYNYLPLWEVPQRYTNRNRWRVGEPDYDACVALPARIIGSNADPVYPKSIARFVECRSLFGGTTTSQGLSSTSSGGTNLYQGLIRNVEAPLDPGLRTASGKTLDYAANEIAEKLVPALARQLPFFYHLSEGTDDDARQRFLDLNYRENYWAITADLIAIHCTALRSEDFRQLASAGGMVWSPLSNYLLYGRTADIAAAKQAGLAIALGSDWSPSGSKNLLGELKIARIVSTELGGLFSGEELVRMVTSAPANALGWDAQVGTIEVGKKADLVVIEAGQGDPFDVLIDAQESDLLAVIIGGRPRHGRTGLIQFNATRQEQIAIGGRSYSLDLNEPGSDPLAGVSLAQATDALRYGLAHLPELSSHVLSPHSFAFAARSSSAISIDLELEEDQGFHALQARALAAAEKIRPLVLPPITAVDDPDHLPALRRSLNLPDFIKRAL